MQASALRRCSSLERSKRIVTVVERSQSKIQSRGSRGLLTNMMHLTNSDVERSKVVESVLLATRLGHLDLQLSGLATDRRDGSEEQFSCIGDPLLPIELAERRDACEHMSPGIKERSATVSRRDSRKTFSPVVKVRAIRNVVAELRKRISASEQL